MRKIFALMTMLLVVLLLFPLAGHAATTAKLYLNGQPLASSVPPTIVNNSTMVPFRVIAEHLGAKVTWDHEAKRVTVVQSDKTIVLKVNDKQALVNGKEYALQTAPLIVQGRTMIPLRFVGEQLGLHVHWVGATKTVYLERPDESGSDSKPGEDKPDPAENGKPGQQVPGQDGNGEQNQGTDNGGGKPETPGGSGNTGNDSGGTGNNGSGTPILIESITFSMDQIIVQGSGTVKANGFFLTGPDRIVLDLANSQFAPEFNGQASASNGNTYGEIELKGHPFIQKIRYSMYSNDPPTVRIVVDLSQKTGFTVAELPDQNQTVITILTPGESSAPQQPEPGKFKVVIDAGHGGSDPGAISVNNRKEKDFTYAVATKVHQLLSQEPNIQSYLSRPEDKYVELDARVKYANELGADLFVSIHGNKFSAASARGTETYYSRPESKTLAEVIHRHVVKAAKFPDRGVKRADFRVIKATTMPAVLVEVGFLSNPEEEKEMYKEEFQERVAKAIVAGIKEYLKLQ